MLSRKQKWRLVRAHQLRSTTIEELERSTNKFCKLTQVIESAVVSTNEDGDHIRKNPVLQTLPTKLKSALSYSHANEISKKRQDRFIRFSTVVRTVLVPSRNEQIAYLEDFYWLREDYVMFKREAWKEIRQIARLYSLSARKAMTFLYQPNYDEVILENYPSMQDMEDNDVTKEYKRNTVDFDSDYHSDNDPFYDGYDCNCDSYWQQRSPVSITMAHLDTKHIEF